MEEGLSDYALAFCTVCKNTLTVMTCPRRKPSWRSLFRPVW